MNEKKEEKYEEQTASKEWTRHHMWYVYYTECKKLNDALVKRKAYIKKLRARIAELEDEIELKAIADAARRSVNAILKENED